MRPHFGCQQCPDDLQAHPAQRHRRPDRQRDPDNVRRDPPGNGPELPRRRREIPGHLTGPAHLAEPGSVPTRPWLFGFPGLFIVLICLSINFIGDGLRDAFDLRQKKFNAKKAKDTEDARKPEKAPAAMREQRRRVCGRLNPAVRASAVTELRRPYSWRQGALRWWRSPSSERSRRRPWCRRSRVQRARFHQLFPRPRTSRAAWPESVVFRSPGRTDCPGPYGRGGKPLEILRAGVPAAPDARRGGGPGGIAPGRV